MAKHRKKPVVVEAEEYKPGTEDGFECFPNKYERYCVYPYEVRELKCEGCPYLKPYLDTKQGKIPIANGDMIITQEDGERYPCNPVNFAQTHEPVEGDAE